MVAKILQGHGAVGNDHPIGPANAYYAADLPQNEFDPDKAKFLLAEAGLDGLTIDLSTSTLPSRGPTTPRSFIRLRQRGLALPLT